MRVKPVRQHKIALPPVTENEWKAGALGLLASMTPKGQQNALKEWAKISERAGGPFCPPLATPPALVAAPVASELLANFTVLDMEFQGTNILELAAIRYERWEAVEEYESLVYFDGPLNSWITANTSITTARLRQAPSELTVLRAFFQMAKGSVLVAHNAAAADKRVLKAARERHGATQELPNPWLCTMAVAKQHERAGLLPKGQGCGISDLCLHFGIDQRGHHQAKRDVQMCYQVLRCLHAQQPITELITSTAKPKAMGTGQLFATAA